MSAVRRVASLVLVSVFVILTALFPAPARGEEAPTVATTRVGAFIVALADVSEAQRRFDVTFWVWLLSPPTIGDSDPGKTLEVTNAVTVERQHAVTTTTPAGLYTQVKFRAQVRNQLDFADFPFDRHVLEVHLEDAERDTRKLEFVPDTPPGGGEALTISQDLSPADWAIGALSLTTEPHSEPTNFGDPTQSGDAEFSRAVLRVEIVRKHSLRILLTLLLGTFMGSVVAFFAVMLPIQQSPPRYTLLSGALFVCIANRLLVDSRLPPGSSLGLLDQLQLIAIIGLMVLTGASLVLTYWAEQRMPPARATRLSQRLAVGWLVAVTLLQLLVVWSR
jgi:hypothetical protein